MAVRECYECTDNLEDDAVCLVCYQKISRKLDLLAPKPKRDRKLFLRRVTETLGKTNPVYAELVRACDVVLTEADQPQIVFFVAPSCYHAEMLSSKTAVLPLYDAVKSTLPDVVGMQFVHFPKE